MGNYGGACHDIIDVFCDCKFIEANSNVLDPDCVLYVSLYQPDVYFPVSNPYEKIPVLIVTSGVSFNLVNGFLIGYYFGYFSQYDNSELFGMRFLTGTFLFILGVVVNWNYDNKLIHLRRPDETDYLIPQGKLFELISCPNLLGEVIEWTGYAIMCWNLPAISFLVWTIANLVPRALAHHKWYNEHFENYPAERKAIFPFIL